MALPHFFRWVGLVGLGRAPGSSNRVDACDAQVGRRTRLSPRGLELSRSRLVGSRTPPSRRPPNECSRRGSFPRAGAVQLVRATLLLAWSFLRAEAANARVLFGMTQEVAAVFARLTLEQIDGIASKHSRHVRAVGGNRFVHFR